MAKSKAQQEIDKLANYIMNEIPGEPSQDGSAVDTIIRLHKKAATDSYNFGVHLHSDH